MPWEGIELFLEPGAEVLVASDGDAVMAHLVEMTKEGRALANRRRRPAGACWRNTPTSGTPTKMPFNSSVLAPPRTREMRSGAIAMNLRRHLIGDSPHPRRQSVNLVDDDDHGRFGIRGRRIDDPRHQRILRTRSHATLTHSPWRGLAASRAGAWFALGGSAGFPC